MNSNHDFRSRGLALVQCMVEDSSIPQTIGFDGNEKDPCLTLLLISLACVLSESREERLEGPWLRA